MSSLLGFCTAHAHQRELTPAHALTLALTQVQSRSSRALSRLQHREAEMFIGPCFSLLIPAICSRPLQHPNPRRSLSAVFVVTVTLSLSLRRCSSGLTSPVLHLRLLRAPSQSLFPPLSFTCACTLAACTLSVIIPSPVLHLCLHACCVHPLSHLCFTCACTLAARSKHALVW
jgi:hypothetical protein